MWGPNKVGFDASISDSKVWRTEADSPFYIVRLCVFPCRRVLRLMSISNIFYIAHCLNWSCIIYIGILIQVQQINVSLEMDPQLRQLIISSWMLHNKSREFIRGPEVPSSPKAGVRQDRHHHLYLKPHKHHHYFIHRRRLGNWKTVEIIIKQKLFDLYQNHSNVVKQIFFLSSRLCL